MPDCKTDVLIKKNEIITKNLLESKIKQKNHQNNNIARFLKYVSLIVLVIQNAGQVLIIRYVSTRNQDAFLKTVVVFFSEIFKFFASLILLTCSHGSLKNVLKDLRYYFIYNFLDSLKVGVPAFIYTIQNFLLFVSIENLDAGTYMVTYQLKTLTTALFTVLILKRRISLVQWFSLLVLACGVAIVQISAKKLGISIKEQQTISNSNNSFIFSNLSSSTISSNISHNIFIKKKEQNPFVGLSAVITASFLSGFAGIYFEKILKSSNASLWLRNAQLSFFSILISVVLIVVNNGEEVIKNSLLQGFDLIIWVVVIFQAIGGLIVAVVIKYADNILKAFATSVAIVVSSLASIFLFSHYPKLLFILGATFVISAVIFYSLFPYKIEHKKKDIEEISLQVV